MRNITTTFRWVGALLCVVFLVAATPAFAALPEFHASATLTGTGTASTLKTVGGGAVKCTGTEIKTSPKAEVIAGVTKEIKNLVLLFKGCESNTTAVCHTGSVAGEIETAVLKGILGYVEPATLFGPVALGILPNIGVVFAKFTCGTRADEVTGCVLGKVTPVNTVTTSFHLHLAESSGKQDIVSYEPVKGTKFGCSLKAALNGVVSSEAGIELSAEPKFSLLDEIDS